MPAPSPETVEQWLRDESRGLVALGRALLRDEAAAEDAAQETWLRALGTVPERPGSWLRTVLRRLAFRRTRTEQRLARREAVAARPEATASTADVAETLDLRRRVVDAVAALEEPFRTTVVLRYFQDRSVEEIAVLQSAPPATVKTRLRRALARLRGDLDAGTGDRPRAWRASLATLVGAPSGVPVGTVAVVGGAFAVKKLAALVLVALLLSAGGYVAWRSLGSRPDSETPPDVGLRAPEAGPHLEGLPASTVQATPADDAWVIREGAPVPDATFAGRVVDEAGAGIPGAVVRLIWNAVRQPTSETVNGDHLLYRRERERREAPSFSTNRDGYFRMDRPYTSESYLRANAEGFATTNAYGSSGAFVRIVLKKEGTLRIRVLTEAGAAVPGAEVRLVSRWDSGRGMPMNPRQVIATATTDGAGRADLPTADRGRFALEVAPAEPTLGIVQLKSVEDGPREVEVRVPAVRTVTKHVVDADTGAPLPEAYADVLHEFRGFGTYSTDLFRRRIRADREGVIELPYQDGTRQVVSAPGYEAMQGWLEDPIRIARAMRIEGTVRSPDGKPVPDAGLFLVLPGNGVPYLTAYLGESPVVAFTDAEGRFEISVKQAFPPYGERVPDRGFRALIAAHPDHPAAAVEPEIPVVPGRTVRVDLRFPRPAVLEVTAVDAEGKPVAEKTVIARRLLPVPPSWAPPQDRHGVMTLPLVRSQWFRTDAQGRARLEGLPPGPHEVRVENVRTDVDVVEGETKPLRVVLGAGPFIAGRVVDAGGQPVKSVQVGYGTRKGAGSAQTDAEGHFRFDDLFEEEYELFVYAPQALGPRRRLTRRVRPSVEVEFRLPAGLARLRIHLEGAEGGGGFQLTTMTGGWLVNSDEKTQSQTSFESVPSFPYETAEFVPGPGLLIVRGEAWGWRVVPFDAAEAATTDVRVVVEKPGTIEGRALGPTGKWESVWVEPLPLFPGADQVPESTRTWAMNVLRNMARGKIEGDRSFRIQPLPAGRYLLRHTRWEETSSSYVDVARAEVDVRSGETSRVDLAP